MFSLLVFQSISQKKQANDVFAGKECKNIYELMADPPQISSSTDVCIDATDVGFVVTGTGPFVITDADGKEYSNAYGAADGKYLIKTTSTSPIEVGFIDIGLSTKTTSNSIVVDTQIYLVTKQNWDGHMRFHVDFVSEMEFTLTRTKFVVYNPNGYTAEVTPENGILVSHDERTFTDEKITVSGTNHLFDISKTGDIGPYYPEQAESYTAAIKITSEKQTIPEKVVLVEKGVFYGETHDVTDEEIADNVTEEENKQGGGDPNKADNNLTGGEIAGIVIASVVVVGVVAFCVVWFAVLKKGCNKRVEQSP